MFLLRAKNAAEKRVIAEIREAKREKRRLRQEVKQEKKVSGGGGLEPVVAYALLPTLIKSNPPQRYLVSVLVATNTHMFLCS